MKVLKIEQRIIDRDPVYKAYVKDICRYQPLSREEELALGHRIQEGDEAAFQQLVNANLRFVISVASHYMGMGLELMDLISEGNIGLIEAARRYDPERGLKFISHAVWWIRQKILLALSEKGRLVRIPAHVFQKHRQIFEYCGKFAQENLRLPSEDEVIEGTGLPKDVVTTLMQDVARPKSLDAAINDDEETPLLSVMVDTTAENPEEAADADFLSSEVMATLAELPEREAVIVKKFYGIGCREHSLEEISLELGICRERVRQLLDFAKRKLQFQGDRLNKLVA